LDLTADREPSALVVPQRPNEISADRRNDRIADIARDMKTRTIDAPLFQDQSQACANSNL